MKKLSQLEAVELFTIDRHEPNRFVQPRFNHLVKRGLIHFVNGQPDLTAEGRAALRRFVG